MPSQTTLTLLHKEAKKRVFLQGTVSQFTWWETQRPPPMGNQLENNPWGIGLRIALYFE